MLKLVWMTHKACPVCRECSSWDRVGKLDGCLDGELDRKLLCGSVNGFNEGSFEERLIEMTSSGCQKSRPVAGFDTTNDHKWSQKFDRSD